MLGQRFEVALTFSQWRHFDLDDVQPIEQIFSETAGNHLLLQILVGSRDNPNIH